jgi:hypothetical protein
MQACWTSELSRFTPHGVYLEFHIRIPEYTPLRGFFLAADTHVSGYEP